MLLHLIGVESQWTHIFPFSRLREKGREGRMRALFGNRPPSHIYSCNHRCGEMHTDELTGVGGEGGAMWAGDLVVAVGGLAA